ncbi:hypothetical protein POVCU2_0064010 [Plasmodium ovale curtisi]|uniref:Uncharacterized protein n=1 Tax=Plasmodium ovale curtisi TaxID=864141 RepID=A0A1A8WHX8_PLAOA|nr:hypothetical protein POVCU1_012060 [Plasmodium ovale curtisi]SBS90850.1 hypothetical protein POVCU2_0064010 [Plasmodium ovale curtisi]
MRFSRLGKIFASKNTPQGHIHYGKTKIRHVHVLLQRGNSIRLQNCGKGVHRRRPKLRFIADICQSPKGNYQREGDKKCDLEKLKRSPIAKKREKRTRRDGQERARRTRKSEKDKRDRDGQERARRTRETETDKRDRDGQERMSKNENKKARFRLNRR